MVHSLMISIGQKDRPGIGINRSDMPCSIIFLVGPCSFMLADDVVHVVLNSTTADKADLASAFHGLPVEEHPWLVITNQGAILQQSLEIRRSHFIYGILMRIRSIRQIDFRPDDMKEAVEAIADHVSCFLRIHDVIRGGGDGGSPIEWGMDGLEGLDSQHVMSLPVPTPYVEGFSVDSSKPAVLQGLGAPCRIARSSSACRGYADGWSHEAHGFRGDWLLLRERLRGSWVVDDSDAGRVSEGLVEVDRSRSKEPLVILVMESHCNEHSKSNT